MVKALRSKWFIIALIVIFLFVFNSPIVMAASFNAEEYDPGDGNYWFKIYVWKY